MNEEKEKLVIDLMSDRLNKLMPATIKIADKMGKVVRFHPTEIHKKFKRTQKRLAYVLKPRQVYFTSFAMADNYLETQDSSNFDCAFYNLKEDTTKEVFRRCKAYNEMHGFRDDSELEQLLPKIKSETSQSMIFSNGSSIQANTLRNDGSEEQARALSRSIKFQRFHGTEAAFWRHFNAFNEGLMASIPRPHGRAVFETTGNGPQGGFYETFMSIVENGQQVEKNVWHLGDQSAHFFEWWLHDEYIMDDNPLEGINLAPETRKLLEESEAEHLAEMGDNVDDAERRLNYRRYLLLNEYKLLKDPVSAIRNCDREYPANYRHSFSGTGSSFLPIGMIDRRRDHWKASNLEDDLPINMNLRVVNDEAFVQPGTDIKVWAQPAKDDVIYKNRYLVTVDCGGGNQDSDYDAILVKDRLLNLYCAVAHGRYGPRKAAELAVALCMWYDGYLNFEVNNHGHAFAEAVERLGFRNVHRGKSEHGDFRDWGTFTSAPKRTEMINHMYSSFTHENNPFKMPYVEWYREAAGFKAPENNPNGKIEGQGVHDDLMMATAIGEITDLIMPEVKTEQKQFDYAEGTLGAIKQKLMKKDSSLAFRNY